MSDCDTVDLARVSIDFADRIPTVPADAMTKALLSTTNSNDPLGITVPGQIIDSTVDNAVFTLGDSLTDAVPNPHIATDITTGNIESGGRESSDRCLGLVFCVLPGDRGVINRTNKDGFVRLKQT